MLRLYQRDSGNIVTVRVGETFEVVLDGDPSTDIHWIHVPVDPDLLEQVADTDFRTDLQSPGVERRLFTQFRATAVGGTRLLLDYGTDVFEVWIVVKAQEE